MHTVYKRKADEHNTDFLEALKVTFKHKEIEIAVTETGGYRRE